MKSFDVALRDHFHSPSQYGYLHAKTLSKSSRERYIHSLRSKKFRTVHEIEAVILNNLSQGCNFITNFLASKILKKRNKIFVYK